MTSNNQKIESGLPVKHWKYKLERVAKRQKMSEPDKRYKL
jgi:hypothetical protein